MRLTLSVEASLEELTGLQESVTAFGAAESWPPEMAFQVELTLEEICVNIVNYGFDDDGDQHAIEVIVDSEPDALTMEIIDNGRAFDPLTETPEPDLDSAVGDRPIGGLGVHLVKQYMDELQYRRADGRNHLKMVKHRSE